MTLLALPGAAQQPSTNAGQGIIASSPDSSGSNSNQTSASGSSFSILRNKLRLFEDRSPVNFDKPSLAPAPPPMPAPMRRAQKSPDDRQWEFMSPAEILGITPDKSAQKRDHTPRDDEASLTPLDRSLEQQNPSSRFKVSPSYNSTWRQPNSTWSQIFGGTSDPQTNALSDVFGSFGGMRTDFSKQDTFNDTLSGSGNSSSVWGNLFGMPSPPADRKPDQEQQQDMKQFMELLNRGSIAAAATTPPTTALPVATSTQPLDNSIGSAYVPLSSGIAKPAGLTALPAVTRQAAGQPTGPPAWGPQPPPWLNSAPQPFAVPQRKF